MNAIVSLELSDKEFASIQKLVFDVTGINLGDSKRELVKRRFSPRIRALGLGSFGSYVSFVQSSEGAEEVNNFCNAITTNLTSFFRENHHFEYLRDVALPKLAERNSLSQKLRIWSAGCSTGQEPYCLSIILRESFRGLDRWDARILATDLDQNVLATARNGEYALDGFEKTPKNLVESYFEALPHDPSDAFAKPMLRAKAKIRELITFNRLNLMVEPWPMKGKFDVIMCRNVFIYFDKPTQAKLIARFAKLQEAGSYLFLGHSEVIQDPHLVGYQLVGKTAYVKI